ncbi:MAG TPA: alpha/beta hydrolase [Candidatus Saccharimonadales bacterium]
MQVIVDSLLTQYERMGKGKTVLLLHGWGDSAAGLRAISQALGKHYDVIALNLPGFGGTALPGEPWGLNDYVMFVAHFLTKLDVNDVWAIVGHSNGAALTIRGVAEGHLHAERVVLIGSAGIRNVYRGRKRMLRMMAKAAKVFVAPLPAVAKNKLRRKAYKAIGSDMFVAEHLQETFKRVVTDDVQADAPQLTQPVLLVYGEDDEQTPVWYGERFHELMPDSTLVILPHAGHFVHLDRPGDVTKAVEEFLQ